MLKLRQQIVRRAVVAQRATEWDAISQKLTDPRARAALDSLRNVHGEIQTEAREYLKEPEAIDFDYYRSVIKNKDLVNALEVPIEMHSLLYQRSMRRASASYLLARLDSFPPPLANTDVECVVVYL